MKGIFWNNNGLRDQAKPRFLFDSMIEHKLDFIALLETKKLDFNINELAHFCANRDFLWDWMPPNGRSGGILVSLNKNKFEVFDIIHGNFILKFKLCNKVDGFEWCLLAVYGAAQDSGKQNFLSELVRMCDTGSIPLVVRGDFNIIHSPSEKNNNRYNDTWPSLFNVVINSLNLRELELSSRQFTWANTLQTPTFEKLDRILVSTEWEVKHPQVSVRARPRGILDHVPLLMDTGMPSQPKANGFKFKLAWLFKDGFHEKVNEIWQRETKEFTSIEIW
jgi:exonuclease III